MLLDLLKFDLMFPTYSNYRIPMWSSWKDKDGETLLEIAIPGYEKNDFVLYLEDGSLFLKINSGKRQLTYSILDQFSANTYKLDKARAEYVNGVLKITIPKELKKTKKIEIKVL